MSFAQRNWQVIEDKRTKGWTDNGKKCLLGTKCSVMFKHRLVKKYQSNSVPRDKYVLKVGASSNPPPPPKTSPSISPVPAAVFSEIFFFKSTLFHHSLFMSLPFSFYPSVSPTLCLLCYSNFIFPS